MESHRSKKQNMRSLVVCLLIFVVVTLTVSVVRRSDTVPTSILIPALWGFGALLPGWLGGYPPPVLGLTRPLLQKGFLLYFLSSAIVFPLYVAGFYISLHLGFPVPTAMAPPGISMPYFIFYNIAVVAFVEELFFRGYLQDRFEETSLRLFSGHHLVFWIPVLSSAALFGVAHIAVHLDPARMVVFFPALLFGWLRAKTGSLIAPILSHASANVLYEILIRSFM
jgi:membrane protease YdiL (CAAX protease family)